jgi:hypothetical protein
MNLRCISFKHQPNNKSSKYSITRKLVNGKATDKRRKSGWCNIPCLQTILFSFGLKNNKHIPNVYKINDKDTRLKLLAGLIDSDGWNNDNCVEIILKDNQLVNDVIYLCRSLGLGCYSKPKIVKGYEQNKYQRISIWGDLSIIPTLLPRKQFTPRKQIKDPLNYGFTIKPIGIDNYYGFELDGNHLYLLGDFSVTHNTTWCQSVSTRLSNMGHKLLWISYELTPQQFIQKFADPLPKFYVPKEVVAYNIEWIESKIKEAKDKFGIQSVFIDHLHYVIDMAKMQDDKSAMIGCLCRSLKQIAIKYGVTVFLIAHTKQPKGESLPGLGDIRDSSFIAQESDAVYAISRLRNEDRNVELYSNDSVFTILKQRETGSLGKNIILTFRDKMMYEQLTTKENFDI